MDEINEQTENMKQIQEALSTPIGSAADFDEVCIILAFLISMNDQAFLGHIVLFRCMYPISSSTVVETIFTVTG